MISEPMISFLAAAGVQSVASLPETISIVAFCESLACSILYQFGNMSVRGLEPWMSDLPVLASIVSCLIPAGLSNCSSGSFFVTSFIYWFQIGAETILADWDIGLLSLFPAHTTVATRLVKPTVQASR